MKSIIIQIYYHILLTTTPVATEKRAKALTSALDATNIAKEITMTAPVMLSAA